MPSETQFGSDDRYYSTRHPQAEQLYGAKESRLEKALVETLQRRNPDLKQTVEGTVRGWNSKVRDILRTETGLRLSVGENRQQVSVRVIDGLPRPFEKIINLVSEPAQWDLALHQGLLTATLEGVDYLRTQPDSLAKLIGEPQTPEIELEAVDEFVKKLVGATRRFNLLQEILSIEEDILGAYFFRIATVCIYWLPIGIIAALLDVSVQVLTTIVLAHELAHAYTHLGLDIDGQAWRVDDFAGCDLRIVEGLVQFYALAFCKKIAVDFPEAGDAFNKLLQKQPGIYWSYSEWIENNEMAGELVRHCLIQTRTKGIRDYQSFLKEVEQGRVLFR